MSARSLDTLRGAIDEIQLVDTHEHLVQEAERLAGPSDLCLWFSTYVGQDLRSAGMSERDYRFTQDAGNDLDTRWNLVEPYWNSVRTTGYGQAIRLAAREMHGVSDIDGTTYRALSEAISASSQSGMYDDVLTDQAGIRVAINDTGSRLDQDARYFAPAYRFNRFLHLTHRNQVLDLEERVEMSIHTLADLERAVERDFENAAQGGMVAVKNADAYHRRIKFDKTPRHDAEVIFNKITGPIARKQTARGLGLDETQPLYDYLWFHILALCEAADMPVQLHTGHFASPGVLTDSYPLLLANIFMEFPRVKFALFHGGFPFVAELGTLGKNFRNVFLDLCWLHIISPKAAADALDLWLELVPSHKIMGFGGDDRFVESSYAQSRIARRVTAEVLSRRVDAGDLGVDEAEKLGRQILHDNAWDLYQLQTRWPGSAA
jgi:predicted TIM-barrel fold metal-dependent hydrolase